MNNLRMIAWSKCKISQIITRTLFNLLYFMLGCIWYTGAQGRFLFSSSRFEFIKHFSKVYVCVPFIFSSVYFEIEIDYEDGSWFWYI